MLKRPSFYVLLCVTAVLVIFSVSGHLTMRNERRPAPPPPAVVKVDTPPRAAPGQAISGSVLDTMGFLLVGADVVGPDGSARTNADGRFQLDLKPAYRAELMFAASGYRPALLRSSPAAREPIVVALEPSAPWDAPPAAPPALPAGAIGEGLVNDADGKPVAAALVIVVETGALARTNDAGQYQIALPVGLATLLVHQPDGGPGGHGLAGRGEPQRIERSQGMVPLPPLIAHPGSAIRGTVRGASGQTQRGVPVQVVGEGLVRTVASGDSGSFRVGGLQRGSYEVRPFAFRGELGHPHAVELTTAVAECEVQLQAAPARRVQIVTETGAPVARAVVATRVDGLRRGVDRADGEGWVQMRAAVATAEFEVRTGDDFRPMRVIGPLGGSGSSPATDRLVVALP